MQHYIAYWTNYFNFSGRTTRTGYWMAWLFNCIVSLLLGFVTGLIPKLAFVTTIFSVACIIPGLAIAIRRLRDAGKGWGWIFINCVPLVGSIIFLVLLCQPSVAPPQRYEEFVGDGAYDF